MLVSINENDPQPIYLQIVRQIKEQVLVGELNPGDELPSVRELGDALGISLHTARSAYQTLSEAGLLRIRLGKRARIVHPTTAQAADGASAEMIENVRDLVVDAMLNGMTSQRIHQVVDAEIGRLADRRREADEAEEGRSR